MARALPASSRTIQTAARRAAAQEYCCRAAAAAAAAPRRGVHGADHLLDGAVEERPRSGRGRPRSHTPRPINAIRSRLTTAVRPQPERHARREAEAGCCVRRTQVPTTGALAQSAGAILTVYQDQHGTAQHDGFLQAPVMVNRLLLQKPERIEALGMVLVLALLIWRWLERSRRAVVDTSGPPLTGWDRQATERPPAFMMVTQGAGGIVVKRGDSRQLARPLSVVHQQSLRALAVPVASCTACTSGSGHGEDCRPPLAAAPASPTLVGRRPPADERAEHEQPPGAGTRAPAGEEHCQPEPSHLGRAGLACHGSLVWRDSRTPDPHSRGSARGLTICREW